MLANKIAVITGAGRGIGRATAEVFARNGAALVLVDLDPAALAETEQSVKAMGVEAYPLVGDITKGSFPGELDTLIEDTVKRVDILINNAGFAADAVIHKMSEEQWENMLEIHLTVPFRLIKSICAKYMRDPAKDDIARGHRPPSRKIVNVSSIAGIMGNPGQISYAAAKAGVLGLTKTVAREWGRFNINVNAVAFGAIETRMTGELSIENGRQLGMPKKAREALVEQTPLGRMGTPGDAANAILFLSSPLSDFVSGHTLIVSGGWYM